MGRFAFGKRRSAAESENDIAAPSFRVLERTDVSDGANFDGGARLSKKTHAMPQTSLSEISLEDNIFAELKPNTNRYVLASFFLSFLFWYKPVHHSIPPSRQDFAQGASKCLF